MVHARRVAGRASVCQSHISAFRTETRRSRPVSRALESIQAASSFDLERESSGNEEKMDGVHSKDLARATVRPRAPRPARITRTAGRMGSFHRAQRIAPPIWN